MLEERKAKRDSMVQLNGKDHHQKIRTVCHLERANETERRLRKSERQILVLSTGHQSDTATHDNSHPTESNYVDVIFANGISNNKFELVHLGSFLE